MATPEAKPKKTRRKIGYQVQVKQHAPPIDTAWLSHGEPHDTMPKAVKAGKEATIDGEQFQIVRVVAGPFTKRTQTQTKVVLE